MSDTPKNQSELTNQLQLVTDQLTRLKDSIHSGEVDARVLREFRWAVDHIRLSAWAVSRWLEEEKERGDPYRILPYLVAERVRRATSLSTELTADLSAFEAGIETPGLGELYAATEELLRCLEPIVKKPKDVPARIARDA
jgi:hypothetical protein